MRKKRHGCTKKSVLVQQRKNDSSPAVTSFLKIMIGENLSRFLYLPPKFARTVMHLAGQKTQLEDVNGLRWSVTVRVIDGTLAFGSGWSNFFSDHNITEGEFLVFDYVKENYFLVKIFEISCCEKVRFVLSRPQLNKRRRVVMEIDSEVDPDQTHNPPSQEVRKCLHCEITKTPQWRAGPMGRKTLCNACGVRYKSGRLFPEYRPAASPTFVSSMHSNLHKKVVEMRIKGMTAISPPTSAKPDSGRTI